MGFFALLLLGGVIHIYNKPQELEVDFLDVGQGDAALIKLPNGEVTLIDGGPDNRVLRRLGENLPFYRRQIDYIILSHYHDDHTTGLVEILKRYKVKNIIYAAGITSSPIINELLTVAKDKSVSMLALSNKIKIPYNNGCFMNLLNPASLGVKDDSNNSLVARLNCGSEGFLFSGDNSSAVEKILVNSGWNLRAAVFKASHHGSNSANSELFLMAVNPRLMVISVGADNKFGHPSPKIMARATDLQINTERTDKLGTVRVFGR